MKRGIKNMTKRILSVVLVLVVFFGGYAAIPKKYNLLPVNDVFCATNYGGVYQAKKTFTAETVIATVKGKDGKTYNIVAEKTYYKNQYYTVTDKGYDSQDNLINLKPYLSKNFYRIYH